MGLVVITDCQECGIDIV